jgi:hypothetical protein
MGGRGGRRQSRCVIIAVLLQVLCVQLHSESLAYCYWAAAVARRRRPRVHHHFYRSGDPFSVEMSTIHCHLEHCLSILSL